MTRARRTSSPVYYPAVRDIPAITHEHAHATNVIHDAFGPAHGLPWISVVERPPQPGPPRSVHEHRGWRELIVMLSGEVVLWWGPSADALRPYPMSAAAMFLIPDRSCHVFVNGSLPAQWMIAFTPSAGTPAVASREEISRDFTTRDIPIPVELAGEVQRSFDELCARASRR